MNPLTNEERLNHLLRAYRDACDPGEPSPQFMPKLWDRIESRRSTNVFSERWARIFASAAVALAAIAILLGSTAHQAASNSDDTWVEAVANHSTAQTIGYYEPVHLTSYQEDAPSR